MKEITEKLFGVALMASKPEKTSGNDQSLSLAIPIDLKAWATPASTEEEAMRLSVKHAETLWPKSEGWKCHSVSIVEIVIKREFGVERSDSEPIELIM